MGSSILVVEDDEAATTLLRDALNAAGFEVATAAGGRRGMELLRARRYHLVILDVELPDADGFALLADLAGAEPPMPVVVVSALSEVSAKVLAFDLGAVDYLTKPFDTVELVARVRRQLGRIDEPRQAGEGWLLDPERRMVGSGPRAVALSALEWRLLAHLLARKGAVCTREELIESVWGDGGATRSNVVDVCIRRLRRKLGPDAVTTVRGKGYRSSMTGR